MSHSYVTPYATAYPAPLRRIGLHLGFGLYLVSNGKYENQILSTGMTAGTPQQALGCACDLYLGH